MTVYYTVGDTSYAVSEATIAAQGGTISYPGGGGGGIQGSGTLITPEGTLVPGGRGPLEYGPSTPAERGVQFEIVPKKKEVSGGVTFNIPEQVRPSVPAVGQWWTGETGIEGLRVGEAAKTLQGGSFPRSQTQVSGQSIMPQTVPLTATTTYDPRVGGRLQQRLGLSNENFRVLRTPEGKYFFEIYGMSISQDAINAGYKEEQTQLSQERRAQALKQNLTESTIRAAAEGNLKATAMVAATVFTPVDPFGFGTIFTTVEGKVKGKSQEQINKEIRELKTKSLEWMFEKSGATRGKLKSPEQFITDFTMDSPTARVAEAVATGYIAGGVAGAIIPKLVKVPVAGKAISDIGKFVFETHPTATAVVATTGLIGIPEYSSIKKMKEAGYTSEQIDAAVAMDLTSAYGFMSGFGTAIGTKSPELLKAEKDWKLRETQSHEIWKAQRPKVAYNVASDTYEFRPTLGQLQDLGISVKGPSGAKVREYADVRAALGKLKEGAPTRIPVQTITTYGEPLLPKQTLKNVQMIEFNVPKGKIPEYLQLERPAPIPILRPETKMTFSQVEGTDATSWNWNDLFGISKTTQKLNPFSDDITGMSIKMASQVKIDKTLGLDISTERVAQVKKIEVPGQPKVKQIATKTETTVTADVTGFMDPIEIGNVKQVKALNKLQGAKITQTPSEAWADIQGGKLEVELFKKEGDTSEVKRAKHWTDIKPIDFGVDVLGPAEKKTPSKPFFRSFDEAPPVDMPPEKKTLVDTGGGTQQIQIQKEAELKQQRQKSIDVEIQYQEAQIQKKLKKLEESQILDEELGLKKIPKARQIPGEKFADAFGMPSFPLLFRAPINRQAQTVEKQLAKLWGEPAQLLKPAPKQEQKQSTDLDFGIPLPPVQGQPTKPIQKFSGWDDFLPLAEPPRPRGGTGPKPPPPGPGDIFGGDAGWLPPLPPLPKGDGAFFRGKSPFPKGTAGTSKYKPSFGAIALNITAKEKDIAKAFTGMEIRPIPVFNLPKAPKRTKAEIRHKKKADKFLKSLEG